MKTINLDAAAGMPMHPSLIHTYTELALELTNPHSVYSATSRKAADLLKEAEERVCYCINADPSSSKIIWTGSGSHANQLAKRLIIDHFTPVPTHSNVEHKSLHIHGVALNSNLNASFDRPVSTINNAAFTHMLVNNETGTAFKNIVSTVKVGFKHSDCIQALGKIDIDVEELDVDAISLSSHKIGGPGGLGCLWVRSKATAEKIPYQGTPNVAACYCFAERMLDVVYGKHTYRDLAWSFIDALQVNKCCVWTDSTDFETGILSIGLGEAVDAASICMEAADQGVIISTGAACNADNDIVPSPVLMAFGLNPTDTLSTVRVSFHDELTEEDVVEAAEKLTKIVNKENNNAHDA